MTHWDDIFAGTVYGGVAAGLACLAIFAASHYWRVMRGHIVTPRAQKIILGIAVLSIGEALLTGWFAMSRFLGRPDWTFETDVPLIARIIILYGVVLLCSVYGGRLWLLAPLVFIPLGAAFGAFYL